MCEAVNHTTLLNINIMIVNIYIKQFLSAEKKKVRPGLNVMGNVFL